MNTVIRSIAGLSLLMLAMGCGPKVDILTDPVSISGKLTKGGAPLGSVVLHLQPLEQGHPVPLQVGVDGSFSGRAVPGKYAYYVAAAEGNPEAMSSVDAKFKEADMGRTVIIKADQPTVDVSID